MKISEFKLGSDPEVFLKRKDNSELFPAIDIVQGTKNRPTQMKGLGHGFTWQVDGLALEYNTPPANSAGEWVTFHMCALDYIKKNIPEDLQISDLISGEFAPFYFDMPGARELGCSSTLNAWTQSINPVPTPITEYWRCSGGHVHIGFPEGKDMELGELLIKVLDLYLTIPSLLIDTDKDRRQCYGKAGEFRFGKSYKGVEHRSLSNFWLQSEELIHWVYIQVKETIKAINNGFTIDEELGMLIQEGINNYNTDIAEKLIYQFNLKLPQSYESKSNIKQKERSI